MTIQIPHFPGPATTRIDSIRNKLNENEYAVDIQQLTSKLIDMEIALISAAKKKVA